MNAHIQNIYKNIAQNLLFFLPTLSSRVVKDRIYAGLTSYDIYADRVQVQHQNKAKWK